MAEIIDYLREFNLISVVVRLLLALLAGAMLGYGRSCKKVNAGLRTYILVCLGAALTAVLSTYEYQMLIGNWNELAKLAGGVKFDASRFSAAVISGIGFLAAGTIIGVAHQQISGLTTAIGLFTAACVGIAAGAAFYEAVILGIFAIAFTLEMLKPVENWFKRRLRNMTICVEFSAPEDIPKILQTIEAQKAQVFETEIERTEQEGDDPPTVILAIKLDRSQSSHSALLSSVAELPCVQGVQELIY